MKICSLCHKINTSLDSNYAFKYNQMVNLTNKSFNLRAHVVRYSLSTYFVQVQQIGATTGFSR